MFDYGEKWIRWTRRLSFVPRWTVVPTIRKQNVAEHSYHVACTCMWLLNFHERADDLNLRLAVLETALEHDVEEAAKGDSPGPGKAEKDYALYSQRKLIVKIADLTEALAFTFEEIQLGNTMGTSHSARWLKDELHKALPYFDGRLTLNDVMGVMESASSGTHPLLEAINDSPS